MSNEILSVYKFTSDKDEVSVIAYNIANAINIVRRDSNLELEDASEDGVTITKLSESEAKVSYVELDEEDKLWEPYDLDDVGEPDDDGRNLWTFFAYMKAVNKEMVLCSNIQD